MRMMPIPPAFMYSASLSVSDVCGPMPKNSAGARGGGGAGRGPAEGEGEGERRQGGGECGECRLMAKRQGSESVTLQHGDGRG